MIFLFYIFVGLVIFHFVWEGIIAPSYRLEIRYKLFKLRDELRRLKIAHGDQFSNEIFNDLQKTINNEIGLLHNGNIGNLYKAYQKFGDDENLLAEMERLDKLVKECSIERVEKLRNRSLGCGVLGFLVNSGGWGVYIIPPVLVLISYGTLHLFIKKLVSLPERDIDRLIPPTQRLYFMPRH